MYFLECTALLLQHGVAVNAVRRPGRTALWWAYYGPMSIVELLVEGGSDIETGENYGRKG
jgi:ankyrin repeat protein